MKLIESDVIIAYESGDDVSYLAKKFNCNRSSIHRLLKRNGIKTRGIGVYDRSHLAFKLKSVEADIISAYQSGSIVESLAKQYECEPSSIHRLLRRNDVEIRGIGIYDRSHLISNSPLSA